MYVMCQSIKFSVLEWMWMRELVALVGKVVIEVVPDDLDFDLTRTTSKVSTQTGRGPSENFRTHLLSWASLPLDD